MRLLKTFLCFLFLIAASIAPAAALPMCEKMTKLAAISDTGDMPHCSGSKGDTSTQSIPPTTDPTTTINNPPHQDGCCCDGDMDNGCKTHCKTITGAASLTDAEIMQPSLETLFSISKAVCYTAFQFKIITPPPKSCT